MYAEFTNSSVQMSLVAPKSLLHTFIIYKQVPVYLAIAQDRTVKQDLCGNALNMSHGMHYSFTVLVFLKGAKN